MILKICGLKRAEDLKLAQKLGADIVGMICLVPESPRNNSEENLKKLISNVERSLSAFLFRNAKIDDVLNFIEKYEPNIIHLCGNEDDHFRKQIMQHFSQIKVWQTVGIPIESPEKLSWLEKVKSLLQDEDTDQIVLDTSKAGLSGGTGKSFPFQFVSDQLGNLQREIIFAGGLNLSNIKELFSCLTPKGIDVSSGVESIPGKKDPQKLKDFISIFKQQTALA